MTTVRTKTITTVGTKQIQTHAPDGILWVCSIGNPNREPISINPVDLTGLGQTLSPSTEHGLWGIKRTESAEECPRQVSARNTEEFIGLMVPGILKQM